MFLKISKKSQKNNCARVSFLIKLQAGSLQLYQTKTPAEMFSCEFCENIRVFILKNIADDYSIQKKFLCYVKNLTIKMPNGYPTVKSSWENIKSLSSSIRIAA